MADTPPIRLVIASTWEGAPAAPGERVTLLLEDDGETLRVSVDAPRHDDPPPDAPPGPVWGLWEHEVVELFVLGPDETYTELELGPHGHHLLLRLAGRRNVVERMLPVDARWGDRGADGRWRVDAVLPAAVLPPRPWRINAYTIHGKGGGRRYLAWSPAPGEAPDFHRLETFRTVPGIGATA